MPASSRLHALLPIAGLLLAAILTFLFKPAGLLAPALLTLAAALSLCWWRYPRAYQRLQQGVERVLLALSSLLTFPVLLVAYFLLLAPVGLLLRGLRRDLLGLRQHASPSASEWRKPVPRQHDEDFFRAQF